jgi:hypothetical protein
MSSFDSADLFGSGPHRFSLGPRGQQLALNIDTEASPTAAGLQAIGNLDGEVIVRGRLIAADDAALQTLIGAVAAKLTEPPVVANLIDNHANTYSDVAFISFTQADRTDRARQVSLAYTARFLKFRGW